MSMALPSRPPMNDLTSDGLLPEQLGRSRPPSRLRRATTALATLNTKDYEDFAEDEGLALDATGLDARPRHSTKNSLAVWSAFNPASGVCPILPIRQDRGGWRGAKFSLHFALA
jgi:hypothetical protein